MTQRVGVTFDGSAVGAIAAAKETSAAIDKVKVSAGGTSVPLRGMERDLGRVERGALASSGAFSGLGRSIAFASTAFIGAAGFVDVVKSSIDVVLRSQTSIALLDRAVVNAHASIKALTPVLEDHAAKMRLLGFNDDDTRAAEAKLVIAFGATKQSLGELQVAADLARTSNTDLGSATRQLILLQEGNARAAKQFGLALPDLTKKQWEAKAAADGLNLAQEKGKTLYDELLPRIKDQAAAYAATPAGKIAEFHAEVQKLQESIGTGLLPVVDKYLTEIDAWLAKGSNQAKVTRDVRKVVDELASGLHDAKVATQHFLDLADPVVKALGGWKTVIEDIIALKFASVILGWTSNIQKAAAASGLLRTRLLGLKTMGPIVIAVGLDYFFNKYGASNSIQAAINPFKSLGGDVAGDVTGIAGNPYPADSPAYFEWNRKHPFATSLVGSPVKDPLATANPTVSAGIVSTAKGSLGVPYQYGGLPSLSKPTDCSGLMVAVFAKNGISLPRTSQAQYASAPIKNAKPLLPGDLVFSEGIHPGHVGLYIGDGMVLEDPHTGDHVKTIPLSAFGWNGESARWWGGLQTTSGGSVGSSAPASSSSPYGPSTLSGGGGSTGAATKPKWVGATAATITSAQGSVSALLRGLPANLDPVEKNAVAHIKAIQDSLHIHMSADDLAKDRVELGKWGKVLHDEISKNAKVAAAAAAEAKKSFDQALSLDISHVLRDFDQGFAAQMQAFDRETSRSLHDMQTSFSRQQQLFDRQTQQGLQAFVVAQTPEEKALADFIAQRAGEQHAATVSKQQSDLAAAIATGDPTQIQAAQDAINQQLEDDQQAALQTAADASRVAQNAKTSDQQQAYQDERDAAKQAAQDKESDAEQAYQDGRDAQKQALQNINDDQKTALQNNLDDWVGWLDAKKKTWSEFVAWLKNNGFDTSGLVDPNAAGGSGFVGSATPAISRTGPMIPFASGGKVPGTFVGREDTIMARLTPGETVIDRTLTAALEDMVANGGNGGPTVAIFNLDGQEFARAVARPVTDQQARQIGYKTQRS